jgi:hypothetical protein
MKNFLGKVLTFILSGVLYRRICRSSLVGRQYRVKIRPKGERVMGVFDFVKCVVEEDRVYCTDAEGNIYEMPLPKKISVPDCPTRVIQKFLAQKDARAAMRGE